MGIAERRFLKGMGGYYEGEQATAKVVASTKPKEKKPIAKQSAKKKAQLAAESDLFARDKEFYMEVWNASPHVCQCGCNAGLGKEPLTTFFHHVLPKSSFPQFRHVHENIMILHPDCHNSVEASLDNRPGVKLRKQELLRVLLG